MLLCMRIVKVGEVSTTMFTRESTRKEVMQLFPQSNAAEIPVMANAALAGAFARIDKDLHFSEPGSLHKYNLGGYDDSYSDHEDGDY